MEYRKSQVLFLAGALLATVSSHSTAALADEVVSRPFSYSGYTEPQYTSTDTTAEFVTMADGVKLAVDVHLPSSGTSQYPTIFIYHP